MKVQNHDKTLSQLIESSLQTLKRTRKNFNALPTAHEGASNPENCIIHSITIDDFMECYNAFRATNVKFHADTDKSQGLRNKLQEL